VLHHLHEFHDAERRANLLAAAEQAVEAYAWRVEDWADDLDGTAGPERGGCCNAS
jgi:hypothetical protein